MPKLLGWKKSFHIAADVFQPENLSRDSNNNNNNNCSRIPVVERESKDVDIQDNHGAWAEISCENWTIYWHLLQKLDTQHFLFHSF